VQMISMRIVLLTDMISLKNAQFSNLSGEFLGNDYTINNEENF
jgi:hypothetical protein